MNEKAQATSHFFSGRYIGRNLKEVSADLIQTENDDLVSRWFHSAPGTDLFTWADRGSNIIKQQLSFHGQVVEWNCLDGIRTGLVIESDMGTDDSFESVLNAKTKAKDQETKDPIHSEMIQFDKETQTNAVDLALEILRHIEIDPLFRVQLVENFEKPQNIKSMSPELFIERFGMSLKNHRKADQSIWDNLRGWLQTLFKS